MRPAIQVPKTVRALTAAGLVLYTGMLMAQTTATGSMVSFTATTDNVVGAHESIRIDVLRWSTDAERDRLVSAWTNPGAPPTGGRGGRGAPAASTDPFGTFRGLQPDDDPALDGVNPTPVGRGAGGRGGRGGRGGEAEAPRPTPERSLAAALGKAPTVGHLWSSEVAGYSLRYAVRLASPDGGERVILITDRRLGAWNDLWKPVGDVPTTNDPFSIIELRLNSKGEGEGKISLTGKVAVDGADKMFALETYAALPVMLKTVKRRGTESVRSK